MCRVMLTRVPFCPHHGHSYADRVRVWGDGLGGKGVWGDGLGGEGVGDGLGSERAMGDGCV